VGWAIGAAVLVACTAASGCSSDPEPCLPVPDNAPEVALVDNELWEQVAIAHDPWIARLPAEVTCGAGAFKVESGALEIDTGVCNFITLQQPLLADVERCDLVRLMFWHLKLYAGPEGAQAYAALKIGDRTFFERDIPIPPKGALEASYTPAWDIEAPISKGTPVRLHIQNHGLNSWKLLTLTRHRKGP